MEAYSQASRSQALGPQLRWVAISAIRSAIPPPPPPHHHHHHHQVPEVHHDAKSHSSRNVNIHTLQTRPLFLSSPAALCLAPVGGLTDGKQRAAGDEGNTAPVQCSHMHHTFIRASLSSLTGRQWPRTCVVPLLDHQFTSIESWGSSRHMAQLASWILPPLIRNKYKVGWPVLMRGVQNIVYWFTSPP